MPKGSFRIASGEPIQNCYRLCYWKHQEQLLSWGCSPGVFAFGVLACGVRLGLFAWDCSAGDVRLGVFGWGCLPGMFAFGVLACGVRLGVFAWGVLARLCGSWAPAGLHRRLLGRQKATKQELQEGIQKLLKDPNPELGICITLGGARQSCQTKLFV